ncbi:MAG: GNAT family N-acetyltransferase [Verrucomicrobia bacterium]|nr:GNAT family N-acetyltransferase [Verrucomicrobiota bacterium]
MDIDTLLERYPKTVDLKGTRVVLRPLQPTDVKGFHAFFCGVPETERMFLKHRVTDIEVIRQWCTTIDYGRNLPLLAMQGKRVVADATLHQQFGGWRRHIGRISVVTHPDFRGRGLGRLLVEELIHIAQHLRLERVEAEFIGNQVAARKLFARFGFDELLVLPGYVKDMQAIDHDYVLMGRKITTDEEFTSAAG